MSKSENKESWHLFFSFNWTSDGSNQDKIRKVYDAIKAKKDLKIWWDDIQLKDGKKISAKTTYGIRNSSIFVCFITSEYSQRRNCMCELALAWNLEKPILFFVNQNVESMDHKDIVEQVFKEAAFYLRSSFYYTTHETLIETIQLKLINLPKKAPSIKMQEDTNNANIVLSYHPSVTNQVMGIYEALKDIIPVNYHSCDFLNPSENKEKIKYADLILVFFSNEYAQDECCNNDFACIQDRNEVLKINFTAVSSANQFQVAKESCIEFHEDPERQYLSGKGKVLSELVMKMKHILPRPFLIEKNVDITVLGTEEYIKKIREREEFSGMRIETLALSEDIEPNYQLIDDTKLMIVIHSETVNRNSNSIEELKFAKLMRTEMIIVQDVKSAKRVNEVVESIKADNRPENNFKSLTAIRNNSFVEKVKENLKLVEERENMLAEVAEVVNSENSLLESGEDFKPAIPKIDFITTENETKKPPTQQPEKKITKNSTTDCSSSQRNCFYAGVGNNVEIFDVDTCESVRKLGNGDETVTCLELVSKNYLASGYKQNVVKIWDLNLFSCVATLHEHKGPVLCLKAISDQLLASGSEDHTVLIWNMSDFSLKYTFKGHNGGIYSLLALDNRFLASGSTDCHIRIWDLNVAKCVRTLMDHSDCVTDLILMSNKIVSASSDTSIKVWNSVTYRFLNTLCAHTDRVYCLKKLNEDQFASGSEDKSIKLWDLRYNVCILSFDEHVGSICHLELLSRNILACACSDQRILTWDLKTYQCVKMVVNNTHVSHLLNDPYQRVLAI